MKTIMLDRVEELYSTLRKNLDDCQSVYDVAAACYCTLLDTLGRDDNVDFIADINAMTDKDVANKYWAFRDNVVNYTDMIETSRHTVGIEFDGFLQKLTNELDEFECPQNIDKKKNLAFCAFYIIEAIDSYVEKYVVSRRDTMYSFGPLNKNVCCEKCVVYFRERESILINAYNEKETKKPFRKQLHEIWVGNVLNELLIISTRRFDAGIPEIKPVGITLECRQELTKSKMLKIANIPFIGFDTFNFYETDNQKICDHGEIPQGKFSVKYYNDDTENVNRILKLMEKAINDKVNIIIFPEFVLSGQMLSAMKKKLAQISTSDKQHLIMVFAGTSCELEHEDKEGHNILHVLSPGGYEIGKYYKYSPFNIQNNERPHGSAFLNKNEPNETKKTLENMPYLKNCELLSVPGKECCLFDVDVIGRVLPAICRDVIDGKYTDNLIKLFLPTLLLVPAWSGSISGFETRFSEYANTVHTSSLLCNCCNAVDKDKITIGKFVYPVKEGSDMQSVSLNISRTQGCREKCMEDAGCVKLIDFDFTSGKLCASLK